MKHLICLFGLLAVATSFAAENDDSLVPAQECRPRAGLPNFLAKARTPGAEIKIGYFGGSITAQNGWRPKTLAHFQKTYPQAKFSEINAAIGGTGSDLGVFRLKQDVLDHKPDLMFVEFAVNDGGASPGADSAAWKASCARRGSALPECDICFVYTLTEALAPAMLEGKFQRSASAMEKIADHYGIPTIHMAMEVAKLAKEGKLEWKAKLPKTDEEKKALEGKFVFAPDSVHPHVETGHELYLQAIVRSLEPIAGGFKSERCAHTWRAVHRHELRAGQTAADRPRRCRKASRCSIRSSGGLWQTLGEPHDALHKASNPGDTITLQVQGHALLDLRHRRSGWWPGDRDR
jgi:lysophospholipase L1-like esterase